MRDPNPAVSGQGFAQLRARGIEVNSRRSRSPARALNEDFAKWIRTGLPFVTLKTALTLDGQIAATLGSATWITSEASRDAVQRLRHEADALLTGIGTVLADDPRLTDRTGEPRRRTLLRAIVDSRLRMPLRSNLVQIRDGRRRQSSPRRPPTRRKLAHCIRAGVEVVRVPARRGPVDLHAVLRELGQRQILNVLLEAGAELNGAALEAGIVDKMILFYAPKIMGTGGVPMARIPSSWFSKSPALTNITVNRCGPDFVRPRILSRCLRASPNTSEKLKSLQHDEDGGRLRISLEGAPSIAAEMKLGDSISVNGCCLTVVEFDPRSFAADLSGETLCRTAFGEKKPGQPVNLERPLAADRPPRRPFRSRPR